MSDKYRYKGEQYELEIPADRPFVFLNDNKGDRIAELFVLSSINTVNGHDDTTKIESWKVQEQEEETVFSLNTGSSVWEEKIYRIRCKPNRFLYEVEVEGSGKLDEVNYFGGYYSGNTRWGSGFFWSGYRFSRIFNPEPNTEEQNHYNASTGSMIDLTGVPVPGKGDWFFTPPPFCFAAQYDENRWVGFGIEARKKENRFTEYRYQTSGSGFCLSLSYEGHTSVNGSYKLPAVGFDFSDNEYGILEAHVEALQDAGFINANLQREQPSWWKEPIYCGWGSQCYESAKVSGHAPDFAKQTLYEEFMKTLDENQLSPGIVVIDDKWQSAYGENEVDEEKWPDLRRFIDDRHAEGKKVLLWLKAWDAEGIPAAECVTNAAGIPLTVDPTNPDFEKRFRSSIRRMLSDDGYGADGFKIDFSARIPSGPGLQKHGDLWGLELMKKYLSIIYEEAKQTKPDALVMAHTPHPYLNDVVDMIRLNDINTGKDVNKAMVHRAKVAAIGCPDAIIDTDNWPMTDKETWREYVRLQPQLGVPSLYFVSHIDSTKEALENEDYNLIRQHWEEWRNLSRETSKR